MKSGRPRSRAVTFPTGYCNNGRVHDFNIRIVPPFPTAAALLAVSVPIRAARDSERSFHGHLDRTKFLAAPNHRVTSGVLKLEYTHCTGSRQDSRFRIFR